MSAARAKLVELKKGTPRGKFRAGKVESFHLDESGRVVRGKPLEQSAAAPALTVVGVEPRTGVVTFGPPRTATPEHEAIRAELAHLPPWRCCSATGCTRYTRGRFCPQHGGRP